MVLRIFLRAYVQHHNDGEANGAYFRKYNIRRWIQLNREVQRDHPDEYSFNLFSLLFGEAD